MQITLEQIAPLVGKEFIVHTPHGAIALSLSVAKEIPRRGLPEQFRTPLSLIFDAAPGIILEQGNYHIDHPLFDGQPCWIVPISASIPAFPVVPRYQIIFS